MRLFLTRTDGGGAYASREQIPDGAMNRNHEPPMRNGGKGRGAYAPGATRSPQQHRMEPPSPPSHHSKIRPHHEYAASVGGRSNAPSVAASRTPSTASMMTAITNHNGYAQNNSSQVPTPPVPDTPTPDTLLGRLCIPHPRYSDDEHTPAASLPMLMLSLLHSLPLKTPRLSLGTSLRAADC